LGGFLLINCPALKGGAYPLQKMRFHSLTDNTNNYLPPYAANNFACGVPKKLDDDEIPFTFDDVKQNFLDEETAKCFSCSGWFPVSSCVINHTDAGDPVPVCETCVDGRFRPSE